MKTIVQNTYGVRVLLSVNYDRLLVPLIIIGALTVAGWAIGYTTVH